MLKVASRLAHELLNTLWYEKCEIYIGVRCWRLPLLQYFVANPKAWVSKWLRLPTRLLWRAVPLGMYPGSLGSNVVNSKTRISFAEAEHSILQTT